MRERETHFVFCLYLYIRSLSAHQESDLDLSRMLQRERERDRQTDRQTDPFRILLISIYQIVVGPSGIRSGFKQNATEREREREREREISVLTIFLVLLKVMNNLEYKDQPSLPHPVWYKSQNSQNHRHYTDTYTDNVPVEYDRLLL